MKIPIFKVVETSYRHGDENGTSEILFSTKELMDGYFDILYQRYTDNTHQHEVKSTEEKFEFHDGGKWSYEVYKEITEITIYESLNELK